MLGIGTLERVVRFRLLRRRAGIVVECLSRLAAEERLVRWLGQAESRLAKHWLRLLVLDSIKFVLDEVVHVSLQNSDQRVFAYILAGFGKCWNWTSFHH